MKGRDLPRYVHRRKRDGVLLFRKREGKAIREVRLQTQFPEGAPVPFALHQEVERLIRDPAPVTHSGDMPGVVKHYRASPAFTDLAPRTRKDYDTHLSYFSERLANVKPKDIARRHIIAWQEKWSDDTTPHKANYRRRVLSVVMEHARDMGLLPQTFVNPCQGVKSVKYEKTDRQPWPDTKVAAFRKSYPYDTRERLCFELLLGTGQRIGDVLRMQWAHIEGEGIRVRQGKTGKPLWLPLTSHLRAALEVAPRRSLFILSKDESKTQKPGAWAYRSAAEAMRDARKAIGAERYDIHGLRYTAAVELLLAGCEDDDIAAVTGQSRKMVEHYTRHVRQRVRARKAQERRE